MTDAIRRNVSILGSTGSIGTNCLDVISRFPDRFKVSGLAAGRNVKLLAEQINVFKPDYASVIGQAELNELKSLLDPSWKGELLCGHRGLIDVAADPGSDTVVSAIVGGAGLPPTWAAVQSGKRIALANKETLVMAGELVMEEARIRGAEILPVDSEHSAIFQSLRGQNIADVKRLILTASGGPFRDLSIDEMAGVTLKQALDHPNWCMGAKITIDSSTLMNKGLETIEARWLFGLGWDKIHIHIHPQSIVHSMVEYIDGSVIAQLGVPDMRAPIAYAMSYPDRLPLNLPGLNLTRTEPLTFQEPDFDRFPCLALALKAGERGGTGPAILNAANEIAVQSFLDGEIKHSQIHEVVSDVLTESDIERIRDIEHVLTVDRAARQLAARKVQRINGGTP